MKRVPRDARASHVFWRLSDASHLPGLVTNYFPHMHILHTSGPRLSVPLLLSMAGAMQGGGASAGVQMYLTMFSLLNVRGRGVPLRSCAPCVCSASQGPVRCAGHNAGLPLGPCCRFTHVASGSAGAPPPPAPGNVPPPWPLPRGGTSPGASFLSDGIIAPGLRGSPPLRCLGGRVRWAGAARSSVCHGIPKSRFPLPLCAHLDTVGGGSILRPLAFLGTWNPAG